MTRSSAASFDEISSRHGCIGRTGSSTALPTRAPYDASMLIASTDVAVGPSLAVAFVGVRGGHEVVEVYVRPTGTPTFEPLRAGHLALTGQWAVVARQRHPHEDPMVVGVMLAKDEADVVADVIASVRGAVGRLYYYADGSTNDAILRLGLGGWASFVPMPPGDRVTDGHRQVLLDAVRSDHASERRPIWVVNVQGDEVYADDLLHHVRLAQREQATVMCAQVATFVLHESQREGWDWSQPLDRRLTHYAWDLGEHAAFVDFPWVHWRPGEHMRAHPHGMYPAKYALARPVRRHCPFRSPEQARARVADRLASGWQPHYANYQDVFMGDVAAGRPVKRYWGWFPEAERVDGIW